MKFKLEITTKEKHILHRLLAVVLLLTICFTIGLCIPELEKYITGPLAPIVAFWFIISTILTGVALFKHYR